MHMFVRMSRPNLETTIDYLVVGKAQETNVRIAQFLAAIRHHRRRNTFVPVAPHILHVIMVFPVQNKLT